MTERVFRACLSALLLACAGVSQCPGAWTPGPRIAGGDGSTIDSMMWDPDGPGPLQQRLLATGSFTTIGTVAARNMASWDPATGVWAPVAPELDGPFRITALANGDLIATGTFTSTIAPGPILNGIARWNGTAWLPVGGGVNGSVWSVAELANGDLIVSGVFNSIGGVPAQNIARWDGTSWHALATGLAPVGARQLCVLDNGDLIAGGTFTTAGGAGVFRIARWSGGAWSSMPPFGGVNLHALLAQPGGRFLVAISSLVLEWTGSSWNNLVVLNNQYDYVQSMDQLPNGDVLLGGAYFHWNGSEQVRRAGIWDGTTLQAMGDGFDQVVTTVTGLPSGDAFVGGYFLHAGDVPAAGMARWDGTDWNAMSDGQVGTVRALLVRADDSVVTARTTLLNGIHRTDIYVDNGTTEVAIANNVQGVVRVLAESPTGELYAGGDFQMFDGLFSPGLVRWDGANWSNVGGAMTGPGAVQAILTEANGDVIVGGGFTQIGTVPAQNIARWDGSAWTALGTPGFSVNALARMSNGELAAGGSTLAANRIASWDGTSWNPLGPQMITGTILAMTIDANGDLIAAGDYILIGGTAAVDIARWDGSTWHELGNGIDGNLPGQGVRALVALPDGRIVAGGRIDNVEGQPADNVAIWNRTRWFPMDGGVRGAVPDVFALAEQDGEVLVGGAFTEAGGNAVAGFARYANCEAIASTFGVGCAGPAGPLTLTTSATPMLGTTFTTQASGFAANAVGVVAFGDQALMTALPPLVPQALPGCTLYASPDFLTTATPAAGVVTSSLPIPSNVALLNVTFAHQVLQVAAGPQPGSWTLSSSNGMTLVLGN